MHRVGTETVFVSGPSTIIVFAHQIRVTPVDQGIHELWTLSQDIVVTLHCLVEAPEIAQRMSNASPRLSDTGMRCQRPCKALQRFVRVCGL